MIKNCHKLFLVLILVLGVNPIVRAQDFMLDRNLDQDKQAHYVSGSEVLKAMHKRYKGKWCKTITFVQRTERYRKDTLSQVSTWYEAMQFPDKFRIDFGELSEGNGVVFRNDSVYHFEKGVLGKKEAEKNELLLLLGGMYFRDIKEVLARLEEKQFHIDTLRSSKWQGRLTYVLGDSLSNQIWLDAGQLRVVRLLERDAEHNVMDTQIESYQASCGGFIETKVSFRRNGHLIQVEYYTEIRSNPVLPATLFDPGAFGKAHWKGLGK